MSKVILVTGGAQGIGRAIAERFVAEGDRVFLSDIDAVKGAAAAAEISATFLLHDVASQGAWEAVVAQIESAAGMLDVLVNNAAIEGDATTPKDIEGSKLEDWSRIVSVNTSSVYLGCKLVLPLMSRAGSGAIINIASVASLVPTPFLAAYGASKAAVQHFTRSMALHCGQAATGIRCNSVHPGHVLTPMLTAIFDRLGAALGISGAEFGEQFRQALPLKSFQEASDIANLVYFLASDQARWITGQSIAIDSGFTLTN